jgi:hypothetical protein
VFDIEGREDFFFPGSAFREQGMFVSKSKDF